MSDADARDFVGVDASDTLVPILRPAVERFIQQHIGYEIERTSYTRYFPKTEKGGAAESFPGEFGLLGESGGCSELLQLDHMFVRVSGVRVWEGSGAYAGQVSDFDDDDELTVGDDFAVLTDDGTVCESGQLRRLGAVWPTAIGSVKVTYTAGLTDDELLGASGDVDGSPLRLAVLLQLQAAYKNAKSWQQGTGPAGPIISESVPGYTYTLDRSASAVYGSKLLPMVEQLLAPFRMWRLTV